MIYFYADPHFGHAAAIAHAGRPFANVEEMDRELVAGYRAWVTDADTVYWLGDCFFGSVEKAAAIMAQLPGAKVLVRGNHDRPAGPMARLGFALVTERAVMRIAGHTTVLCHYPYRKGVREGDARDFDYPHPRDGWALVHGHTHSKKRRDGTAIHVGVDAWDFQPVPYADVEALVRFAFNEGPQPSPLERQGQHDAAHDPEHGPSEDVRPPREPGPGGGHVPT